MVIDQSPKLQFIIFELSYHTLEQQNSPNYHRNSLYLRFYDINLYERNLSMFDYSIYLSNPKLYNRFLNPFAEKIPVNKFGFVTKMSSDNPDRFHSLNYNKKKILNDTTNLLIKRHQYKDIKAYNDNTTILSYLVRECIKEDIIPIIISPPVYTNYRNSYLSSKEKRRKDYLKRIIAAYPSIIYLDYEQDNRFEITDFKNEDHLNANGAKKLTIQLNDTLVGISSKWHNKLLTR